MRAEIYDSSRKHFKQSYDNTSKHLYSCRKEILEVQAGRDMMSTSDQSKEDTDPHLKRTCLDSWNYSKKKDAENFDAPLMIEIGRLNIVRLICNVRQTVCCMRTSKSSPDHDQTWYCLQFKQCAEQPDETRLSTLLRLLNEETSFLVSAEEYCHMFEYSCRLQFLGQYKPRPNSVKMK